MNIFGLYQGDSARNDLKELFTLGAQQHPLGLPASFLEKDIWVTELLRLLYEEALIGDFDVAFKGGTALSKCWGAIERFSEDIDLSIHWADLSEEQNEEEAWAKSISSRSQSDKFRKQQSKLLSAWSNMFIQRLNSRLQEYGIEELQAVLEADSHGEKIDVHIPRVTTEDHGYLLDHVLLEFGGRNRGRPNEHNAIKCYLADVPELAGVSTPESTVRTLHIDYILWEKITALHQFSTQNRDINPHRLARHWYDVDCLLQKEIADPFTSEGAMKDVCTMKTHRWAEKGVDFTQIAQGVLSVLPSEDRLTAIRTDFQTSVDGGMFYQEIDSFDSIVDRLGQFQNEFNAQRCT